MAVLIVCAAPGEHEKGSTWVWITFGQDSCQIRNGLRVHDPGDGIAALANRNAYADGGDPQGW